MLIATLTAYFTRMYAFRWREAMTFSYVAKWQTVEEEVEGASQRIQEDIYRFARIFESLGLQVVRAIMTLVAFLPILWGLSSGVDLPHIKDIPGSLVWVALLVSLGRSAYFLVCRHQAARPGVQQPEGGGGLPKGAGLRRGRQNQLSERPRPSSSSLSA